MKQILINVYGMTINAQLIREADPRLAIAQDRVALIDEGNNVIASQDLLDLFKKKT